MSGEYVGIGNLEVMAVARNYNAFLADHVVQAVGGGTRCLDFGAGDGLMTGLVAERGLRAACVEPDPRLRARLAAAGFTVWPDLADCPPTSFEGAYSLNVLEHIEDDGAALRALHARLVPGGRLFVYVPACPVLYSRMDRLVGHFRRYRHGELADKLAAAGFVVERIAFADSLGFFAALAYRLFARGTGELTPASVGLYDRWIFPLSRQLDRLCSGWFGKNLLAVARVPT
jgi:SAM-dependent methyltransferase